MKTTVVQIDPIRVLDIEGSREEVADFLRRVDHPNRMAVLYRCVMHFFATSEERQCFALGLMGGVD